MSVYRSIPIGIGLACALFAGAALAWDDARRAAYPPANFSAADIDRLTVHGTGSSGPVDGMSVLGRTLGDRALDAYSAKDAGAKGDVVVTNAAVTIASGGRTLLVGSALFAPGDVGKRIQVALAGPVLGTGYLDSGTLSTTGSGCTDIPVFTATGGSGYGGSVSPVLRATAATAATAATVAAGGSGYANGTQTLTVRAGYGTPAQVAVTVSGGVVTGVQAIAVPGAFSGVASLQGMPVTGAGGSGAAITLSQVDVIGLRVGAVGYDYPVGATGASVSGGGCATAPVVAALAVTPYIRPLGTTIAGYVSPTKVTLADAASNTLSGLSVLVAYGTDDTVALRSAVAGRPAFLPAGRYFACDVSVPTGGGLIGEGGLGYGLGPGSEVTNTILIATPGCWDGRNILNVKDARGVRLRGFALDCNQPGIGTLNGIGEGSDLMSLEAITVQGCNIGIGGKNRVTGAAQVRDVQLSYNRVGLQGLQDSVWSGGALSANGIGAVLGETQGGNRFVGLRVEHNTIYGMDWYKTQYNNCLGCTFDANFKAGIRQVDSYHNNFSGSIFIRNGRNLDGDPLGDAHIVDYRNTDINYSGITADSFADDGGSGPVPPRYVFRWPDANNGVTISGALRRGYALAFSQGVEPTNLLQVGIPGVPTINTASRPYMRNGVAAQMLRTKSLTIGPGASTTLTITQAPLTEQYAPYRRTLVLTAVDYGKTYRVASATVPVLIPTGGTSFTPILGAAAEEAGQAGVFSLSGGSGLLRLSASNIAADGSSWTLTIANAGDDDGSAWSVWAELR